MMKTYDDENRRSERAKQQAATRAALAESMTRQARQAGAEVEAGHGDALDTSARAVGLAWVRYMANKVRGGK